MYKSICDWFVKPLILIRGDGGRLVPSSLPHQIDEGEEDDDDGGDGALGDRVVHVRDDARDRLTEPRRAQRVPDRLKQQTEVRFACWFVYIMSIRNSCLQQLCHYRLKVIPRITDSEFDFKPKGNVFQTTWIKEVHFDQHLYKILLVLTARDV